MSENLSQLTGIVKGSLWDSNFKFSGTSEFLRLDSGQLISLLNSNFPINMSESEVRLVPGSRCSYFPGSIHIFHVLKPIFSNLFQVFSCLTNLSQVLAAAAKWLEHDLAARLGLADRF